MNTYTRYNRQIQLSGFGYEAQQKLQRAKVLVIGAGGLGVPVLQYLTGMGIGTIGVADGDTVNVTNLHRQVLYGDMDVQQSKVGIAIKKLSAQNRQVKLQPFYEQVTRNNILSLVQQYDLVIDATDNFSTRYLINDACVILSKPYIYGAVHQHEGQVSVFNYQDGPTYRCLYPVPPAAGEIPDCNTAGVLGVVPGIIGCQQALQVVKVITGLGKNLSGWLQIVDFLNDEQYKIKLKTKPDNKQITQLQQSYEAPACHAITTIKPHELNDWLEVGKAVYLMDIREENEFAQMHLEQSHLHPLSAFNASGVNIPANATVVTFCQKGSRSLQAAQLLQEHYPDLTIYSLQGGLEQWFLEVGNQRILRN
jgi:molybdopterin/thiamine biosynthesis adenylyltransferase/rhodanese-related sulfurtransferase